MKEFIKQNLTLILAFSLPVLLIIIVALSTYLPSLALSTNYNFIYTTCTNGNNYYYSCDTYLQNRYKVVNEKLVVNDSNLNTNVDMDGDGKPDPEQTFTSRIFLHDTEKNESREITFEEASSLSLNNLITSPDGVTVSNGYNHGADLLFFSAGSSYYGHYLMKGNNKKRINLISDEDYYENNTQFIGWVLPGRN